MTLPRCDSVAALYALQNSMMLTPCWPSAGPTGGAGVAAPALIWSLMTAVNRFLGGMTSFLVTGWNGKAPVQGPGPSGARVGGSGALDQIFWTWLNDSSTGVSRPKMETSTCSFCCSALISLIVAGRVANGPSMTVTDSPTSKSTTAAGAAVVVAASPPVARAGCGAVAGRRILTTSSMVSGEGFDVAPTKPVTPGVLRTAPQDS